MGNSVDSDQGAVWSGSTLFVLPFLSEYLGEIYSSSSQKLK